MIDSPQHDAQAWPTPYLKAERAELCLLILVWLKPFGDRRRRSSALCLFSGSGWFLLGPENPWRSCGTSRRRRLGNFLRITSRLRHLGLRTFQVRHVGRALFSG